MAPQLQKSRLRIPIPIKRSADSVSTAGSIPSAPAQSSSQRTEDPSASFVSESSGTSSGSSLSAVIEIGDNGLPVSQNSPTTSGALGVKAVVSNLVLLGFLGVIDLRFRAASRKRRTRKRPSIQHQYSRTSPRSITQFQEADTQRQSRCTNGSRDASRGIRGKAFILVHYLKETHMQLSRVE